MERTWPDDADQPSPARAAIGETVRKRLTRNPMVSAVETEGRAAMFLRHGLLNPKECAAMVALIDAHAKPSTLFSGVANADYRTSSSSDLPPHHPLVATVIRRIDALIGLGTGYGEQIQAQRYEPGQEYKLHLDHFPAYASYWPAMRETGGQRCWTAMIYLCDVEKGGETQFPRLGVMIPPRRGTLLAWNNMTTDGQPNSETVHAALPVIQGTKYVLTRWFRERPWTPPQ